MAFAVVHEVAEQLRHVVAGIAEAGHADGDFVSLAYREAAVRTGAEADELRLFLPHAGRTDDERGHAAVRSLFHYQRVVYDLSVPFDSLVGQEENTFLLLPVEECDDRSGGVAYAHLQTGGAAEIRRKLRDGVGGQGQVRTVIIRRVEPRGVIAVHDALAVAVVDGSRNHHVIVARPTVAVESHGHTGFGRVF